VGGGSVNSDLSTSFLLFRLCFGLQARKKYGVDYPALYATGKDKKSEMFNCTQRGHQNFLEGYPIYLMLQFLSALHSPTYSGLAGFGFLVGKVVYFRGYACDGPQGRMRGAMISYFTGLFPMLGMAGKLCYDLMKTKYF